MLTMTRLPSDSFLPSGAVLDPSQRSMHFTSHLNGHSSTSVISPLSLPRALNQLSYFDDSHLTNLPPPNYSHSPLVSVVPRSHQQQLSPRPSPPGVRDQRSATVSPTKYGPGSGVTSPSTEPSLTSPLDMSNLSAADLLRRREEQNRKLLESWRAERASIEASRARAEELYQEERAIMDGERALWIDERVRLEKDLSEWKTRAEAAERERDRLSDLLRKMGSKASPTGTVGEASLDGVVDAASASQPTSRFQSPSDVKSPTSLPSNIHRSTMPESKPFIPLDPRMQGPSPKAGSPKVQPERIPSIDIQEVIPELEGIRLRSNAVQKTTFTDGKSSSPPTVPQKLSPSKDPARSRTIPGELTKEALQAPESDRLTMHAGHTPNHSMSLSRLHTVDSTGVTNTADSSGAPTPKYQPAQINALGELSNSQTTGLSDRPHAQDQTGAVDPEVDQDPELKGPLHLKNLPAADEPFLKALSDKLEHAKLNNIRPRVLKHESPTDSDESTKERETSKVGGDGAHDIQDPLEAEAEPEEDIPLKLRTSSNFGAPLGQLRKPSGF
ncbi:uncharacterized protein F4822DRAFT_117545 [Hypoxylon trugodes]|uniref:uncharacterized protein n=1 Tax=Hypoxylon trugodes TaxID=326681 RepID=UPI00218D3747|nr:uncharacterized protein F4822DRAFT_117545 [Hypoxylon trugodes]KAI1392170.1 hypothetical protein F4822DRAFT_117545 [Hypoxylon trugodes]